MTVIEPKLSLPIDPDLVSRVLRHALDAGSDFADLFIERSTKTVYRLEENRVKPISLEAEQGAGVRSVQGAAVGYAYAHDPSPAAMEEAAAAARAIVRGEGRSTRIELASHPKVYAHRYHADPGAVSRPEKVEILKRANDAARAVNPEVNQVTATLREWIQDVAIIDSAGRWAEEKRVLLELYVVATARRGDRIEQMQASRSGRRGFELFAANHPEDVARQAAEGAVRLLDAVPAPAGPMPVVLGPGDGMTGVLIHEACGHALEADFIMKGNSIYAGKLGQKVASPLVTVIDDATLEGEMGWVAFDDEGVDGQRSVLIRDGVLEGYMCDRIGAEALGVAPTGNGRRESFHYAPLPRMTCTFVAPGTSDPRDIMQGIRRGLYVARMGGGVGDLSGAGFTFAVDEGYLIEEGRITRPVKGATLTGTGWDVLMGVEAVGNDFALDPGGGRCGKVQLVPVSTGLPSLRVREMVVGGTDPGR